MTRIKSIRFGTTLLATASTLALAAPASANELLFATDKSTTVEVGARVNQIKGLKQVRLDSGAIVSFVDAADYRVNADGTVDLYAGSVTVAGAPSGPTIVRMPEGVEGRVMGTGSAASFSVDGEGKGKGHVLTGEASIGFAGNLRRFIAGEMFEVGGNGRARQVVSNGSQAIPGSNTREATDTPQIADMREGGPVAAAQNGLPVTLGDALASAGASGDILAAARSVDAAVANPSLETFPSGDLALLVAAAGNLEGVYGGAPFDGAQADIIRAYLGFLADGGSRAEFLTVYSSFLNQYLDLVRSGAAPSGFDSASLDDINAFIAFSGRTGRFGVLAQSDRTLVDAYLAFIQGGGNADLFAGTFTDLTEAYFAFLRAGGTPADFAGASQETINSYLLFLRDAGLVQQLAATDRALLVAFLDNGGFAFAGQYRTALNAYGAYLTAGGVPSAYTALDQATLRSYLETLEASGLLGTITGERAQFYGAYLNFLKGGGAADAFAGLPANIFAGYTADLNAYFAFLQSGGLPSQYNGADVAVLQAYLAELNASGALNRFLGANSAFFTSYLAFLQSGGGVDAFAGLNANIFAGYASDLNAYYEFLAKGGVPSSYTELTQAEITAYLAALSSAGATGAFLGDLAAFYSDLFAFVSNGGNPDLFANLPVPPDLPAFANALNAYAIFLSGGGLPSDYSAAELTVLANYLEVITGAGRANELLGGNVTLINSYFAFLSGGGAVDGFSGLPVYAGYVNQLNAYFAFLQGGGLPADYSVLTAGQVKANLDALAGAGGFALFADLNSFFVDYYAFIENGGNPANFAGLPLYGSYVTALNAYYTFLINGGLPSEYTALDQATVEAYLAILSGVGVLQSQFSGNVLQFLTDYLAFLQANGDPDMFAGLPGGGATPPTNTTGNPANAVVFTDALIAQARLSSSLDTTALHPINPSDAAGSNSFSYETNSAGEIVGLVRVGSFGGSDRIGSASNVDGGKTDSGNVRWTRWTNGTLAMQRSAGSGQNVSLSANQGYHILTGTLATDLPITGRINYTLAGGTRPTHEYGTAAPGTLVSGSATIEFDTVSRLGIELVFDYATDRYTARTAGGLTDISQSELALSGSTFYAIGAFGNVTSRDGTCTTRCRAIWNGFLAGTGATEIGLNYIVQQNSSNSEIIGNAAFVANTGSSGGNGGGGTGSAFIYPTYNLAYQGGFGGERDTLFYAYGFGDSANPRVRQQQVNGGGQNVASLDAVGGMNRFGGRSSVFAFLQRANAVTSDIYGNENLLIGRWSDGRFIIEDSINATPSANQGLHYMLARGVSGGFELPSGTVHYDLLAATRPTLASGATAPGIFDASMSIAFGTVPQIGIDGSITMPGDGGFIYNFSTDGGSAAPSVALSFSQPTGSINGGFFSFNASGTTDDGRSGSTFFQAALGDAQASQIGVNHRTSLMNAGSTITSDIIVGAAVFGSSSAVSADIGRQVTAAAINAPQPIAIGGVDTLVSVAPFGSNPAISAMDDWARWNISPGTIITNPDGPHSPNISSDVRKHPENVLSGLITFEK